MMIKLIIGDSRREYTVYKVKSVDKLYSLFKSGYLKARVDLSWKSESKEPYYIITEIKGDQIRVHNVITKKHLNFLLSYCPSIKSNTLIELLKKLKEKK